jgi:hypothetical protein
MNNKLLRALLPKILIAILPLATAAQSLHTTAGVKLILSGPVNLVLNNTSFVNDGSFTAGSSKVLMVGNAGMQGIGGTGVTNLNNLSISKSAGFVQLNRNIAVTNLLTMAQGNLELNTFSVNLGATGTLTGESNQSAVTGAQGGFITAVKKWIPGIPINPGNLGIEISTSNNLGVITVERSHLATELLNGGETIRRGYNISNTNFISIPDISLKFSYLDQEVINNVEQGLVMFTRSGIGNFMLPIGADASDPNQNFVHQSGLIQLGFFSVANDNGGPAFRFPEVHAPTNGSNEPAIVRNRIVRPAANVYPNPVHQSFTLELFVPKPMKLSATLVNESGMVVDRKEINCGGDNNTVTWNMLHFSPGNYYLQFNDKNIKTLKIVKY